MSILQVTAERELIEHETGEHDKVHHRLNTVEAQLFISQMSDADRRQFAGIKDPKAQEYYIIQHWTLRGDTESLAGHRTSRALHAVRHFLTAGEDADKTGHGLKRYHFPLLEMPKAPHISSMHRELEARFRCGVGEIVSQAAGVKVFSLPEISADQTSVTNLDYEFRHSSEHGIIAMSNRIASVDGHLIGSDYTFEVTDRPVDRA